MVAAQPREASKKGLHKASVNKITMIEFRSHALETLPCPPLRATCDVTSPM